MNQHRQHSSRRRLISILNFGAQLSVFLLLAWTALPHAAAQASAQSAGTAPAMPAWRSYSFPADGFKIEFPSEPKESSQNVDTQAGTFELRDYLVDLGSTALYVGVCDYGSSVNGRDPQSVLDGAQSGAVDNVKGHVVTSKNIALGEYPGRAFEAENDQLHFSARIYLVGTTLYQTLIAYPLNATYPNRSRFLDSFELIQRVTK